VNVSSIASERWLGTAYVSYAAAKAGANQLTRSIAMQYARDGIRANAVVPGMMRTPNAVASLAAEYASVEALQARRDALCPLGRQGDAWDVAHASLFLASDEARYITGVLLRVDGGLSCTSGDATR
jgi:NAD(P)-dependent dehydrogenase (short-subunit alcohol dehydrogenase family)